MSDKWNSEEEAVVDDMAESALSDHGLKKYYAYKNVMKGYGEKWEAANFLLRYLIKSSEEGAQDER